MPSRKAGERSSVVTEKVKVGENVLNALIWMALREEARRCGSLMGALRNADNLTVGGNSLLPSGFRDLVSERDLVKRYNGETFRKRDLALSNPLVDTSPFAKDLFVVESDSGLFSFDKVTLASEAILGQLRDVEDFVRGVATPPVPMSIAADTGVVKTAKAEVHELAKLLKLKPEQFTLQSIHNGKPGVLRVGEMLDIYPVQAVVTKELVKPEERPEVVPATVLGGEKSREVSRKGRRLAVPIGILAGALGALLLTPIPFVFAFDPLLMRFRPDKVDPVFDGLPEQLRAINADLADQERWVVQVLNVAEVSQIMADALEGANSSVSPIWDAHHRRLMASCVRLLSGAGRSVNSIVESLVVQQDGAYEMSDGNMLPFSPSVLAAAAVAARSYYHGMEVRGKLVEMVGQRNGGADIGSLQRSFDRFIRSLN